MEDSLQFPKNVVLVPAHTLNPEKQYYYQRDDKYAEAAIDTIDDRPILEAIHCTEMSKEEADKEIINFEAQS